MIRLVVGLGNPGAQYDFTPHNIGFEIVDLLADHAGVGFKPKRAFQLELAEAPLSSRRVMIAKPQTFMNASGDAVAAWARKNGIPPDDILVVYDDVELPLGRLRVRPSGGTGGHNGMASLVERLGSREFPRLRVGVGPRPPGKDLVNYVLSKWHPDALTLAFRAKKLAVEVCLEAIQNGVSEAMNKYNSVNLTNQEHL